MCIFDPESALLNSRPKSSGMISKSSAILVPVSDQQKSSVSSLPELHYVSLSPPIANRRLFCLFRASFLFHPRDVMRYIYHRECRILDYLPQSSNAPSTIHPTFANTPDPHIVFMNQRVLHFAIFMSFHRRINLKTNPLLQFPRQSRSSKPILARFHAC